MTVLSAIAAGLSLSIAALGTAEAQTEWRMQLLHPAGTPGFEIFKDHFAPMVEEMSGGRLVITPFAAAQPPSPTTSSATVAMAAAT